MPDEMAVRCEGLSKLYKVYPDSWSRIIEWATRGRLRRHREKWALRDISFEVPRGSALGIVGANGAGKSTLLKVLTGVTPPTHGCFEMNGRVGSLLELGAGFHPAFSGKDNIFMNAAIMGLPKRDVRRRFDEIAEFAELGEYLFRPVRTYSSGMVMRLGFAVAMMARPDILVLDEVMAVGDQHFQKKCMDRIREIRQHGTTLLFVSHSVYHVRQICDQATWINDGVMVDYGTPRHITDEYVNFQMAVGAGQDKVRSEKVGEERMLGSMPHLGDVKVCRAGEDDPCDEFRTGDVMDIHVNCRNPSGEGRFHVGIMVVRNDDIGVFMTRSKDAGVSFEGESPTMVVRVPVKLVSGEFYVSGYLLDETCELVIDQRLAWSRFKVVHEGPEKGVFLADARWMDLSEVHK